MLSKTRVVAGSIPARENYIIKMLHILIYKLLLEDLKKIASRSELKELLLRSMWREISNGPVSSVG